MLDMRFPHRVSITLYLCFFYALFPGFHVLSVSHISNLTSTVFYDQLSPSKPGCKINKNILIIILFF